MVNPLFYALSPPTTPSREESLKYDSKRRASYPRYQETATDLPLSWQEIHHFIYVILAILLAVSGWFLL